MSRSQAARRSTPAAGGRSGTPSGGSVNDIAPAPWEPLIPEVAVNALTRLSATVQCRAADHESGMTTAEYAVGTVAACGFSGVLYKVITSEAVLNLVKDVITKAFHLGF